MSLFSTIQQSANALQVSQLGMHVVGNNIANANTPGYLRQELQQTPAIGLKFGDTILGYGVRATGVVQKLDNFVVDQLRRTDADLQSSEVLGNIYNQVESIFGELNDNDISSQINEFSSSNNDLHNQPGNDSLRRLVIERGRSLTNRLRETSSQLSGITTNLNNEVRGAAAEINQLTTRLADLNKRIVSIEGGRTSGSDAVGLRDERLQVLSDLSKVIDIRAVEQPSGSVTVFVGGEYLVADGIQREVKHALRTDGDLSSPEIRLADTDSPLQVTSGRLAGLYAARDSAISGIAGSLDGFASNLIGEFNKLHTQGQGQVGFSSLVSTNVADDPFGPLDLAGLPVQVENGQFEVQIRDLETGQTNTHTIRVRIQGGTDDTALTDVTAELDAISGISSQLTPEGALRIDSDSHLLEFSFQNDSSNFLAAAGLKRFSVVLEQVTYG